jgi:hypothetical protein
VRKKQMRREGKKCVRDRGREESEEREKGREGERRREGEREREGERRGKGKEGERRETVERSEVVGRRGTVDHMQAAELEEDIRWRGKRKRSAQRRLQREAKFNARCV